MTASEEWKRLFTIDHVKTHFIEKVALKSSVGLDKITTQNFESNLDENAEVICRKIKNGTYKFTRYRQLLFIKGANKYPRAISVPTVRDKLTLSVLNELIFSVYGEVCKNRLPHLIINEISRELDKYDSYIKLDISTFYANIDHTILNKKIKKRIRKKEVLQLIINAIQTDSLLCPIKEKRESTKQEKGVPEGLPISNALANIYLSNIDEKYGSIDGIKYWRYVDDILILLNEKDISKIMKEIEKDIDTLKLSFNDKNSSGKTCDGFEYLGYRMSTSSITVRQSSIYKMEQSLEDFLRAAKDNNKEYLAWRLNNKITGFILNGHKYGWMFFYSQIDNIQLLFHMDKLVLDLLDRYGLSKDLCEKRFVRTYHEIQYALHTNKYIPNFDKYEIDDKRKLLQRIYEEKAAKWDDEEVEQKFRWIMSKEIRDIEKDIENFS